MAGRQDSVLGEERLARVMEEGSGDAVGTRKPPPAPVRSRGEWRTAHPACPPVLGQEVGSLLHLAWEGCWLP